MARKTKKIDENQLSLDFTAAVDHYVAASEEIREKIVSREERRFTQQECEFEICVEVAAAIKKAQRESGLSRQQLVDGVNEYFGRTQEAYEAKFCRKPLSLDMLNHHLSKPIDHPIDAYLIPAFCAVTKSMLPLEPFVDPFGGRVVTGIELQQLELGRLEQTIADMQQIRRKLKKG